MARHPCRVHVGQHGLPRRDVPGSVFLDKPYTAEAVYRACCGSEEYHMEAVQLDPSRPPPPIMERAYELAGLGIFTDVEAICHHLIKKRYEDVFLWSRGGLRPASTC
jgi:hypothetical protein